MTQTLMEVKDLSKYFPIKGGLLQKTINHVKAVNGVSFSIKEGEALGIVGESGCGKSTVGRTLIRLHDATEGKVFFQGKDIFALSRKAMRNLRKDIQIIFQDPFGSLNPNMKTKEIIAEPLIAHKVGTPKEREKRVKELMKLVGLNEDQADRLPHEFSGGQRQRISIARALALNPKLIICDEAVSALDVSIQSQILNLLEELREKLGLAYLFISHDLSVVHHISDRVGVMYLGKLVEICDVDELYDSPAHPYTQALISAIPEIEPEKQMERIILQGDVPSPSNPPSGCPFHPRCPLAQDKCKTDVPEFRDLGDGHWAACHFPINE